MKTGVLIGPCGKVSVETLALVVEHLAVVSKVSADFIACERIRRTMEDMETSIYSECDY